VQTRLSQLRRHGASAAALLLWLLIGSCLNPRPDDLPAGAENGADTNNGTPVNDSARSAGPSAAPMANTPAASGAGAPEDGEALFDVAPTQQDAGVPNDAEPPGDPDPSDAGADAN
jgi:hypothetical protein